MFGSIAISPYDCRLPTDETEAHVRKTKGKIWCKPCRDFNARGSITGIVFFLLMLGIVLLVTFAYAGMMNADDSRGEYTGTDIIESERLAGIRSPPIRNTGYVLRRAVTGVRAAITPPRYATTPSLTGTEIAALFIKQALNLRYAPCDDFYNFVCSSAKGVRDVFLKLREQTREAIRNMLLTISVPPRFRKATEKAAALFRACVRLAFDQQRYEMGPMKDFLSKLRLDISNLDPHHNFNILQWLVYLSFVYGFPTYVRLSSTLDASMEHVLDVEINEEDESWMKKSREKFSGPSLESFYVEYLSAYDPQMNATAIVKDIIRAELVVMNLITTIRRGPFREMSLSVSKLGSLTKGYASEEYMENLDARTYADFHAWPVNEYVKKVWQDIVNSQNLLIEHLTGSGTLKFGNLSNNFNPDDWVRLIEMATSKRVKGINKVDLPENSMALVVLLLDQRRMARNDSRLLIAWSLVHQLVPLASGKFMDAEALERYPIDPHRVLRLCYEYVVDVMPLAVSKRYVSSYLTPSALTSVKQLTVNVMQAVINKLNTTEWIQGNVLCLMYEKALQLRFVLVYPSTVSTESLLRDLFLEVPDIAESFTAPYLAARRVKTMNTFRYNVNVSFNTANVNAVYRPYQATIHFLAGILQLPLFIPGAPAAFNYGSIGQIAGHEVMHAFDVEGMLFDTQQNLTNLENTTAKQLYTSKLLCLRSSYMQVESESRARRLDPMIDSEGFADLAGIQLSYAAYQSLPDAERWATIPDVGLTSEQTFFVSHCMKWCTRDPGPRREPRSLYWHSRSRCIVPLRNMPQFADAFSCKPGDRMNPVKKCSFW